LETGKNWKTALDFKKTKFLSSIIRIQFDAIKTSMLVDKEKGRPLEVEEICGAVDAETY
jgi:ketopantoate reductase